MISLSDAMSTDSFAGLHALVAVINSEKFRFLTAERYRAYAAILWKLLEHPVRMRSKSTTTI